MSDVLTGQREAYSARFAAGQIPFDNAYFDALRDGASVVHATSSGCVALLDAFVVAVRASPGFQALLNAERAAREVTKLLDGAPGEWTLDGEQLTDEAASALLSLHDFLNDVTNAT
ncbi:MAG: hypothetical protein ABW167_07565 [Baekduia sp.]